MTLSEHLDELRSRLLRCVLAAGCGFVLCFIWVDEVVAFLRRPLEAVRDKYPAGRVQLVQTTAGEYVIAAMTVSLCAGLVLAGPFILQQLWGFVAAGLYPHERRSVKFYALPGFALFFAGAAMAYFLVLPWALNFLIGFAKDIDSLLGVGSYVSLVAWMMFVFGLMFQLPLIMVFLMRLGVTEPAFFRRYRRWAIVLAFVVGAILTPPDVISQCVLSLTLLLLYEGAILVGARVARKREEAV